MSNKMSDIHSTIKLHILADSIVRMLMIAGISFAAIHFERISVLWFYLIPALLMNDDYKIEDGDCNETD